MKSFIIKLSYFFWSWGFLKLILWTVTLVIFFYVEEDWRGARAWAATKAKWEAQGESFDPNTYYPRPVPDDQNLAALPIFKLSPDPDFRGTLSPVQLREALREEHHGGDLPTLRSTPDVMRTTLAINYERVFPGKPAPASALAQLEALYPVLPEIHAAAMTRPYCRFNQDYTVQPPMLRGLGLLTAQISLGKLLCLHAKIALAENQPQVALDDIKTNLQLAEGVGRDPTLVAGLVAIGIAAITRSAIDEGLQQHAWNDTQLANLQNDLDRIDFLSQFQFAIRGEVVTELMPNYSWIKRTRTSKADAMSVYGSLPDGWTDLNQSKITDFLFRETGAVDPAQRRVSPDVSRNLEQELIQARAFPWVLAPWNILFAVTAPPISNATLKFAQIQVYLDEDRIVCALERYRLAHNAYPISLDALVPTDIDSLPSDIMNGQPYHYRLQPDGTFTLYSVGWNQTDEGGKPAYAMDTVDYKTGDWPWPTSPPHEQK